MPSQISPEKLHAERDPSPYRQGLRTSIIALLQQEVGIDGQIPTQRDLAQRLNASNVTIGHVLRNLEMEGMIERIVGKGTFLRRHGTYRPTPVANPVAFKSAIPSAPPQTKSDLTDLRVWVVTNLAFDDEPDIDEKWQHVITSTLKQRIQQGGGRTIVTNIDDPNPTMTPGEAMERAVARGINAVITLDTTIDRAPSCSDLLLGLKRAHPEIALLQICIFDKRSPWFFDSVCWDYTWGAYEAALHLLDQGHMEIAFIAPSSDWKITEGWTRARIVGFERALAAYAHRPNAPKGRIIYGTTENPGRRLSHWRQLAETLAKQILDDPQNDAVTAVVAVNDHLALGLMNEARARGRRVPEDLAIVGFDDRQISRITDLTSIHPPLEQMAECAIEQIQRRLRGQQSEHYVDIIVRPQLIRRESSNIEITHH